MSADYQPTKEQFDQCVANWTMDALRDDGLYRHLRFRINGGGFTWFDIVTWPGKLVITPCNNQIATNKPTGHRPEGHKRVRLYNSLTRFCSDALTLIKSP